MKHQISKIARVHSFDDRGRGVARVDGKTVFIEGALPSETVRFQVVRQKKYFDEAFVEKVLQASPFRVQPKCGDFDTCGGCRLQYVEPATQVALKQRVFEDQLARIGKVQPERILPPIYGQAWHYRERCRLSVRCVNGQVVLGFQQQGSHEVVDIAECEVLPKHLSAALPLMREALNQLPPQVLPYGVECAVGAEATALSWLYRERPSENKIAPLISLLIRLSVAVPYYNGSWQAWIKIGSAKPQQLSTSGSVALFYRLPEYDITMPFLPGDFTQSYEAGNRLMITRALQLLDVHAGERVADLFCGIGNFTLPLARLGANVLGVEGLASLVDRAADNAQKNGLAGSTQFVQADLFGVNTQTLAAWGRFDKMLFDPPRDGALALVEALQGQWRPERLVYVSCNPATLARDAAVLVEKGYRFESVGVMNMFAQTSHIEAVASFCLG